MFPKLDYVAVLSPIGLRGLPDFLRSQFSLLYCGGLEVCSNLVHVCAGMFLFPIGCLVLL